MCNKYEGGFGNELMLKDISLAIGKAMNTKSSIPVSSTAKEVYTLMCNTSKYKGMERRIICYFSLYYSLLCYNCIFTVLCLVKLKLRINMNLHVIKFKIGK